MWKIRVALRAISHSNAQKTYIRLTLSTLQVHCITLYTQIQMSHRTTAVQMVFGEIPTADLTDGFGDFVLVNLIEHGMQTWQVGQFLLSMQDQQLCEVSARERCFDCQLIDFIPLTSTYRMAAHTSLLSLSRRELAHLELENTFART